MLKVDLLLHPSFRFKGGSMKLAAHSAGLPGNDLLFDIVPLDPAQRAGLAGHAPVTWLGALWSKLPWLRRRFLLFCREHVPGSPE